MVERLRAAALFARCDSEALSRLATVIDTIEVEPRHQLMRQGHATDCAYVVESGVAEVRVDGEVIDEVTEGEIVGEIALLVECKATATVLAKTPMSLLLIPHAQFDQILKDTPGLGIAIARELAERLHATRTRLH